MISNGVPTGNTGKAVEIHHYLFDALWNIGTRQIDASILMDTQSNSQEEEEKKEEEISGTGEQKAQTEVEGDGNDSD